MLNANQSSKTPALRRAYQAPGLTVYGDVRALTASGSGAELESAFEAGIGAPGACSGALSGDSSCTTRRP